MTTAMPFTAPTLQADRDLPSLKRGTCISVMVSGLPPCGKHDECYQYISKQYLHIDNQSASSCP